MTGSDAAENADFFAECYGWRPGQEGKTGLVGFNHTLERYKKN